MLTKVLAVSALLTSLLVTTTAQAETADVGVAARYRSERTMRRAAEIHGVAVPAGLEACASPLEQLGTLLVVTSRRLGTVWRCLVVDVAHPRDRAHILRRQIVVELTPRGAMHICGSVLDPPRLCPVVVEVVP